jgi:hypothetical protein
MSEPYDPKDSRAEHMDIWEPLNRKWTSNDLWLWEGGCLGPTFEERVAQEMERLSRPRRRPRC